MSESEDKGQSAGFEVVANPNRIKYKAKALPGRSADDMLQRASKAVEKLAGDFERIYAQEIETLAHHLHNAKADQTKAPDEVAKMRRALHDLRGQAGTFGYPLVSKISDSACKFIDKSEAIGEVEMLVLDVHVNGLRAVKHENLKGQGGVIGEKLLSGLSAVIRKYAPERA